MVGSHLNPWITSLVPRVALEPRILDVTHFLPLAAHSWDSRSEEEKLDFEIGASEEIGILKSVQFACGWRCIPRRKTNKTQETSKVRSSVLKRRKVLLKGRKKETGAYRD